MLRPSAVEQRQQLALAGVRQGDGAALVTAQPSARGQVQVELVGELAGEVVAPFRPVEARIGEAPAFARRRRREADALEPGTAGLAECIAARRRGQAAVA